MAIDRGDPDYCAYVKKMGIDDPFCLTPDERLLRGRQTFDDVELKMREAERLRKEAEESVRKQAEDKLREAERILQFEHERIKGSLGNRIDQFDLKYQKCYDKIVGQAGGKLTSTYTQMYGMGIPVPSLDAIEIGKQIENCLAANFIDVTPDGIFADQWPEDILGLNPFPREEFPIFQNDPQLYIPPGNQPETPPYFPDGSGSSGSSGSSTASSSTIPPMYGGGGIVAFNWDYARVEQLAGTLNGGFIDQDGNFRFANHPQCPGAELVITTSYGVSCRPPLAPPGGGGGSGSGTGGGTTGGGTGTGGIPKLAASCPVQPPVNCKPPEGPCPAPITQLCPEDKACFDDAEKQLRQLWEGKGYSDAYIKYYAAKNCNLDVLEAEYKKELDKLGASQRESSTFKLPASIKPKWCNLNVYEELNQNRVNTKLDSKDLLKAFGFELDANGNWKKHPFLSFLYDAKLIPNWVPDSIADIASGLLGAVYEVLKLFDAEEDCDAPSGLVADAILALAKIANKLIGFPSGDFIQHLEYTVNYYCPTLIPSPSEANSAYLAGQINLETWKSWVAAANNCLDPAQKVMEAGQAKPDIFQAVDLYRRGSINREVLHFALRDNGVLSPEVEEQFIKLSEAMPGISDVIRFMVRDAADAKTVKDYNLDAEFDDKWQGELVKYAEALGIPPTLGKYYWRSHWEMPSPTQLFEMLHRLRPGVVDKSLEVDEAAILKALGVNDYAPFWRDKLMAISYAPLTRTDLYRAFEIGSIDAAELNKGYQDNGYTPENAKILVKFASQLKKNALRARAGVPGPKQWISQFKEFLLPQVILEDRLSEYGWDMALINQAVDGAKQARSDATDAGQLIGLQRQYLRQEITIQDVTVDLSQRGFSPKEITELVDRWEMSRTQKPKLRTAAQLCDAFNRGFLDQNTYAKRLVGLGYTAAEAKQIADICEDKDDEKQNKKQTAELEKAERQRKAQQKEIESRQNKARTEAEKQAKAQKTEAEKVRREAEKDQKEAEQKYDKFERQKAKWEKENKPHKYPGTVDDPYYDAYEEGVTPEGPPEAEEE